MNFYTLFTRTENVHLLKDVGMIPEILASVYPDINSYIVTYKNGDYSYIGNEISHARVIFIKRKLGKYLDGIKFIKENADEIDVLNIYHLNLSSYIYCLAAKKYLKKTARIYLKLDVGPNEIQKLHRKDLRAWIKKQTIKLADIVTGESTILVGQLKKEVNPKIQLITNGYYAPEIKKSNFLNKKDRIITVGKLGTMPKNTEMLIDAFVNSIRNHNWELRLIGPYTPTIAKKISDLIKSDPELEKRIVLLGEITDKRKLAKEYEEAKVFALPSRWESFGLVLVEALRAGDFLLVSDNVPAAYDIIYNKDAGKVVRDYTELSWTEEFNRVVQNHIDWEKKCQNDFDYAEKYFKWDIIVKSIRTLIEKS